MSATIDPKSLASVLAPDPFPLAAILRAAVDHARERPDLNSDADVARAAGLTRHALSRALTRTGRETQPETLRRVLRVAGMRITLVRA